MMRSTDTRFLAILTVRDEGAFLIDWLAHHRRVGFTDFLVLSNDCTDGTDRMLDRLQDMGQLTHLPNPGPHPKGAQWSALDLAARHPLMAAADWVMVLDVDEFVTIHAGGGTLPDLLAALPDATALPLTWRLFGNDGQVRAQDRPVPEVFTRAAPAIMGWPWRAAMFKTLYRNDGSYGLPGVHRPRRPDPARLPAQRWFDGSGRELPAAYHRGRLFSIYGQDNYQLAQLNHYPLQSMESYLLKCARGRANREASAFDLSYWVERNLNEAEDRSLADRFAACAPLRDALRADPALGPLHDQAVVWRQNRFSQLMADEAYRSLFARLLMARPSRSLSARENLFLRSFGDQSLIPEQSRPGHKD